MNVPDAFRRVELDRGTWKVRQKYQNVRPIGTGAYGEVW